MTWDSIKDGYGTLIVVPANICEPPKNYPGAEFDVIALGSLYSSCSLGHTTVSDSGEWDPISPSPVSGTHL